MGQLILRHGRGPAKRATLPSSSRRVQARAMRGATFVTALVLSSLAVGCAAPPEGPLEGQLGEARSASVSNVCADGPTVEGIDVSYYQDTVDWPAVKAAGIEFAIARINHGSFMDPEFDTNWAAIKEQGMIRGAYQYFDPGGDWSAQADTAIAKLGVLGDGDLPAVIDVESTDGLPAATIAERVGLWIDKVEAATGKKPIVYTGPYFWNDQVGNSAVASESPLWIAHYTSGCPLIPSAWSDWAFHQYTSSGSVSGVVGDVDRNVFNGTLEDLQALAAGPGVDVSYAAEFVSRTAPEQLEVGESAVVRIVMKNTGALDWDASTLLGTTEPRDRASAFAGPDWPSASRAAGVVGTVPPGETFAFELTIVAPLEPGTYVEHFGLVQEGVTWFADDGGPADGFLFFEVEVVPEGQGVGGAGAGGAGQGGQGEGASGAQAVAKAGCSCELAARPERSAAGLWLALGGLAALARRGRGRRAAPR
jgi:lysozyme